MRHHAANRKFGREQKVRSALLRSLAVSLIEHGKIETTESKAREIRSYVEKLVTRGKNATPASKRLLAVKLGSSRLVGKLVDEVSSKYITRSGGYTRIVKKGPRTGDGSKMAIIEFI